jgi:hypothetical protein
VVRTVGGRDGGGGGGGGNRGGLRRTRRIGRERQEAGSGRRPGAAGGRERQEAANGRDRRDAVNGQLARGWPRGRKRLRLGWARGCGWDGGVPAGVNASGDKGFLGGLGSWEERAFYSAQMLLRARIWPGSGGVESLPDRRRTGPRGRVRVTRSPGHARLIRRVVQARTRSGSICAQRDCLGGRLGRRACILIACHPYPPLTTGARDHSPRT